MLNSGVAISSKRLLIAPILCHYYDGLCIYNEGVRYLVNLVVYHPSMLHAVFPLPDLKHGH